MEAQIIFVALLVNIIISYLLAEFIGNSKHIGFNWSFIISFFASPLIGIIAIVASPSAKKKPTKGGNGYKTAAIIFFIFGLLNLFRPNPMIATFFVLGFYLLQLSNGEIINKKPKFWFDKVKANTISNSKSHYKPSFNSSTSETQDFYSDFNSSDILDRKEKLKNLFEKGILNESEYRDKISALEQIELDSKVKNSEEYKQLKNLYDDGILSTKEFENKINTLKNKFRNKQSDITSKLSYKGFSKAVEIYNLSMIQDNDRNIRTLKIRLQGILNKMDYGESDRNYIREQLSEYNSQLNDENKLKVIQDVYTLPLEKNDENVIERMTLDISDSPENRLIWKTKRDMYGTMCKGVKEYFPDLKSLLSFIQLN